MTGGTVRGPGPWSGKADETEKDAGPPPGSREILAEGTLSRPAPMPAAAGAVTAGAGMFLDAADFRPPTMLDRPAVDRAQWLAGTLATGIVHLAVPLVVTTVIAIMRVTGLGAPPEPEAPPPEVDNVVAARFVVLGEVLDPRMLPDRIVPILRTDTPEPRDAPSLREDPEPPPERERHERDRRSVDDLVRRLSEDAQIFAEAEEARIREGSPEGIEEGTERTGTEGDIYRGRLYTFFRRGWTVPTTLSEEEVEGLQCVAMVEIGSDTRILGWRLSRRSGNAEFDASVEAQLTRITASEPNIPSPPDDVADQYLGREIAIRFSGRDARR